MIICAVASTSAFGYGLLNGYGNNYGGYGAGGYGGNSGGEINENE